MRDFSLAVNSSSKHLSLIGNVLLQIHKFAFSGLLFLEGSIVGIFSWDYFDALAHSGVILPVSQVVQLFIFVLHPFFTCLQVRNSLVVQIVP